MLAKRLMITGLVCVFFGGLFAHVGIELSYASSKPRSPQITSGQTVPITINHGSVVYVNEGELQRLQSVQTAGLYTMLASFVAIGIFKLSVKNVWN